MYSMLSYTSVRDTVTVATVNHSLRQPIVNLYKIDKQISSYFNFRGQIDFHY